MGLPLPLVRNKSKNHANIMMINSSREQIKVKKEVEEPTSEAQDEEEGEIASDEDSPADGKIILLHTKCQMFFHLSNIAMAIFDFIYCSQFSSYLIFIFGISSLPHFW